MKAVSYKKIEQRLPEYLQQFFEPETAQLCAEVMFVILSSASLYRMAMAATQVGQAAYYKALPSGGDWDDAAQTSLKYNAAKRHSKGPVEAMLGSRPPLFLTKLLIFGQSSIASAR